MIYVPSYEEASDDALVEAHDELTRELRRASNHQRWKKINTLIRRVEEAMDSGEHIPRLAWTVHHAIYM